MVIKGISGVVKGISGVMKGIYGAMKGISGVVTYSLVSGVFIGITDFRLLKEGSAVSSNSYRRSE